jgi:hypothetical protein
MNIGPEVKIGSMPSTLLARINKKRLEVALRLVSGALISLTRLKRELILLPHDVQIECQLMDLILKTMV